MSATAGGTLPPLDDPSGRRSVPLLGRIAIATGLAVSGLLFLRLVQVHGDDGPGGLLFAVVYGALLVAPFVASLVASLRSSPRRLRRTWMRAATVTLLVAWASIATWPLAALAVALLLASSQIKVPVAPAPVQVA
jgi:hypothetical protein